MLNTTNFKLIYELFNQILIFDNNSKIVFEGSVLKNILENAEIDFHWLTSDGSNINEQSKLFKETIEKAKLTLKPLSFTFTSIIDEFILLPVNLDGQLHIILAKKEKIIQITKIKYDLNERVKELHCLYKISRELESPKSIGDAMENCIKLVEGAFQYPQETVVNFEIDKKIYGNTTWDPKTVKNILNFEIKIGDKKRGEIRVLIMHDNGFFEEERNMTDEIAGKFERAIEEYEKTITLEKQKKILLLKNDTLLKLTEECNKKQQKLRTFISAITDKIVVIDRDFEIIMSNKEDIGDSGKCYKKLFSLETRCENCPALQTFELAQNSFREREEGDKFLTLRSYPIFDQDGKVDRVLEVCRDITMQKRMEAQLLQSYKLASLGKLVAGVAHEINNPNTFILGNLKIIQEAYNDIFPVLDDYYSRKKELKIARLDYDVFKENISTLIDDMINGANRTKKIVGDLRNFAKKDDGSLTDDVDINYIIKNNLTLTRKHIKKYAQLETELYENIPSFKGNANKLEQVILNLVMNASEAFENGDGIITIKTDYNEKTKEVILIIKDNGCGMDEGTMKNIFDPFFTTKRNKGGTGLGLSISYGIIKDHNGKIDVESKLGVGTIFTIRVPSKPGD